MITEYNVMHVSIRNLGPVNEADIDLKPLTIFIGKNNTGKTWTAYLLASVLSRFGLKKFIQAYNNGDIHYEEVDTILDTIAKTGTSSIDLQNLLECIGNRFLNDLAHLSSSGIGEFLGTDNPIVEDLQLTFNSEDVMDEWSKNLLARSTFGRLTLGSKDRGILRSLKDKGNASMNFYIIGSGDDTDLPTHETIKSFVTEGIFLVVHKALTSRVIFLPPERIAYAALALSAPLIPDSREENEDLKPGSVRLSYPITDLMGMLTWIRDYGDISSRLKEAEKKPAIKKYLESAELVKRNLLCGEVKLLKVNSEVKGKRVLFQPEGSKGKTFEISASASLVKALSPLYLYLTYEAWPGDLLVIDEPEMNLHPEAQVRIMELLAILVNSGVKVIVTTHSPYIVDHLVNIMKGAELEKSEDFVNEFYLKTSDAFISKEKVSVYLFEDGIAKKALNEEGMIDWGTFADVSDQVSKIYFKI